MKDPNQAVKVYQKQLILAKQSGDKSLEAVAYGALGLCHRQMQCFDKALGYHTQVIIYFTFRLIFEDYRSTLFLKVSHI